MSKATCVRPSSPATASMTSHHAEGWDEVEALMINVDRKTRSDQPVDSCQGSGRAERSDEQAGSESSAAAGTTNLGAC